MTAIPVSERKQWVGASEVAALFGASRFQTKFELWHIKMGNIPTPNLDNNERVAAGRHLEAGIAAWASEKFHWPLRKVTEYSPHPTVPRFGASLDFAAIDGNEPTEIKAIDYSVFRDDWESDGDTILDAPVDYLLQVQAQLACRPGPERGWIVACVGGNRILRMEVPRHPLMIERIQDEVTQFWVSVAANEAPEPNFEIDANAISLLYHGSGAEIADLRGNARARDLAALYLEGLEVEKTGKNQKSVCLAELKSMMKDARGAIMDDGYKITASHLEETTSVRKAHWRFSIRKKKEPNA